MGQESKTDWVLGPSRWGR